MCPVGTLMVLWTHCRRFPVCVARRCIVLCSVQGDGVNDAPALKRSHVGFAVSGATAAARSAADVVLTSPGLSVLVDAITGSREVFQRMRSYALYAVAITVRIVVTFSALVYIWRFDMPSFLVLLLALLNDGCMLTISTDAVTGSAAPDEWRLREVFVTGTLYGLYLSASSLLLFHLLVTADLWADTFSLDTPWRVAGSAVVDVNHPQLHSLVYLHTSLSGMALIFSTRAHGLWAASRPGVLLAAAFVVAQAAATAITVYADWGFADIQGTGWAWALVVWAYAAAWFVPMDAVKAAAAVALAGRPRGAASAAVAAAWARPWHRRRATGAANAAAAHGVRRHAVPSGGAVDGWGRRGGGLAAAGATRARLSLEVRPAHAAALAETRRSFVGAAKGVGV